MNYEQEINELHAIQRETTQILRDHNEIMREHNRHLGELEKFRRRTEQNLSEITDKLNGLIGYMDGLRPPPA